MKKPTAKSQSIRKQSITLKTSELIAKNSYYEKMAEKLII